MTKLIELPMRMTTGIAILTSVIFAFFSLVTWVAAKSAILMIAPIVVWSMAIFSTLAALVATVAFCAERGEWYATRHAESKRDRILARNEARQADLESHRQYIRMVAEGKLLAATLQQVGCGLIHPLALGEGKFSSFPAQVINQIENAVPLLEADHRPDLLPALADSPNILIVGGKGRGKTSLLQWLEYDRLKRGNVVTVLDSHAKPSQWGGQVIGAGRKHESIAAAMIDLTTMLDNRYDQRTKGKDDFNIIDTFIDEFTLLPDNLKAIGFNVQDYSKPALTEGRKIGMNCIWGIHSARAQALGLKGAMDLLECFDAIVYLKKVKNDFYAQINFGEGIEDAKYDHPGPFTIARPTTTPKILSLPSDLAAAPDEHIVVENWPKAENAAPPTDGESDVIESFVALRDSDKFSWRKATQAAFGKGKFGDGYNVKLRRILDKFSIDYSNVDK